MKESSYGITGYGTAFRGGGGRIKESPEDFVVAEVLNEQGKVQIVQNENGYPLYIISKVMQDTLEAKSKVERALGCELNILGLKDKAAITYQYASARKMLIGERRIRGEGFVALQTAFTSRPLRRGDLFGNAFNVLVRDCRIKEEKLRTLKEALHNSEVPNFFGPQRFGFGVSNHEVGRLIVKKDFETAAKAVFGGVLPKSDAISSLRTIPVRLRRLYISAYQSYLFNLCISSFLKEGGIPRAGRGLFVTFNTDRVEVDMSIREETILTGERGFARLCPLPGYSFRDREDTMFIRMKEIMKNQGISPTDFFIKEMQEVSAEGGLRPASMIGWLRGWNLGRNVNLRFVLYKGEFATVLLREVMKSEKIEQ